jgi:hypothetical protein
MAPPQSVASDRADGGAYASTGHMDVAKRGRSWLGADRRGRQSFKGGDCDILAQGLIGLIEYSYHQGIFFFQNLTCKELWG